MSAAITWAAAKATITYGDAFSTGTADDKYNNVNVAVTTKDGNGVLITGAWTWSSKLISVADQNAVNITANVNIEMERVIFNLVQVFTKLRLPLIQIVTIMDPFLSPKISLLTKKRWKYQLMKQLSLTVMQNR